MYSHREFRAFLLLNFNKLNVMDVILIKQQRKSIVLHKLIIKLNYDKKIGELHLRNKIYFINKINAWWLPLWPEILLKQCGIESRSF